MRAATVALKFAAHALEWVCLALVTYLPWISLWLPRLIGY